MNEDQPTRVAILIPSLFDHDRFAARVSPSHADEEEVPWVELQPGETVESAAGRAAALVGALGLTLGTCLLDQSVPDHGRYVVLSGLVDSATPAYWQTIPRMARGAFGCFLEAAASRLTAPLAVGVLVPRGDKFAAIFSRKRQQWEIPCGMAKRGEVPPETALREAVEEIGVQVELGPVLFDRVIQSVAGPWNRLVIFSATTPADAELRGSTEGAAAWVDETVLICTSFGASTRRAIEAWQSRNGVSPSTVRDRNVEVDVRVTWDHDRGFTVCADGRSPGMRTSDLSAAASVVQDRLLVLPKSAGPSPYRQPSSPECVAPTRAQGSPEGPPLVRFTVTDHVKEVARGVIFHSGRVAVEWSKRGSVEIHPDLRSLLCREDGPRYTARAVDELEFACEGFPVPLRVRQGHLMDAHWCVQRQDPETGAWTSLRGAEAGLADAQRAARDAFPWLPGKGGPAEVLEVAFVLEGRALHNRFDREATLRAARNVMLEIADRLDHPFDAWEVRNDTGEALPLDAPLHRSVQSTVPIDGVPQFVLNLRAGADEVMVEVRVNAHAVDTVCVPMGATVERALQIAKESTKVKDAIGHREVTGVSFETGRVLSIVTWKEE